MPTSSPPAASSSGSSPSWSESGPASGFGLTNTNGPHVSTATGTSPRAIGSKPGSRSARGALRRAPSRPYVHAWYGHWIVSRLASPSQRMWPRCRQTLTKPRSSPSLARARTIGRAPAWAAVSCPGSATWSSARRVLPGAREDPLLLEPEHGRVGVPVVRQRAEGGGRCHTTNLPPDRSHLGRAPVRQVARLQLRERAVSDHVPAVHPEGPRADPLEQRVVVPRGDDDPTAREELRSPVARRPRGTRGRAPRAPRPGAGRPCRPRSAAAKPSRARMPCE